MKTICVRSGFTLLEVIGVLIIMGVLAAVVSSRVDFGNKEQITLDEIKNHIRYAQLIAMNADYICGISFVQQGGYLGFSDLNANHQIDENEKILLPGMDQEYVSSQLVVNDFLLVFDSWGRPYSDLYLQSPFGGEIQFNSGKSINVTQETGFIR